MNEAANDTIKLRNVILIKYQVFLYIYISN